MRTGTAGTATPEAPSGAGGTRAVSASSVSALPASVSLRLSTVSHSPVRALSHASPAPGAIHRPAGRPRRLLQSIAVCGRCGARLVAHGQTRHETRWRGPTTRRERYTIPIRAARLVCASDAGGCGSTSILAEPTEQLIVAMVELMTGTPLPTGLERQRAAIADEIQRIEVLAGRSGSTPGRCRFDPTRLRIALADGTTTQGTPLPRYAVPWQSWPYNKPEPTANGQRRDVSRQWQAIYRAAGAVLAG
jgi:hypothetical protein